MNIIQDEKGFMWLATWDGLCRFDGYNFTTYKTSPEDSIQMRNNRIDKIKEDIYGYIWLYTYSREPFKFDPKTERYVATFGVDGKSFKTSEILPMASGKVWLTSETMGCICVTSPHNKSYVFSLGNKNISSNKINTVYEDHEKYSWILTDNGLLRVPPVVTEEKSYTTFFSVDNKSDDEAPFYSVVETDSEIWFGSEKGRIWCYNKNENRFKLFETGANSKIISMKKVYGNLYIILTKNDGFIICDKNKTNLRRFDKSNLRELPTNEMLSCYIDSESNIWLEMKYTGIAKFNLLNNQLKYYKSTDYRSSNLYPPYFFIVEDNSNNIWVHPHGCFSYYDKKSDRLLPFFNDPLSPEWRFSDMLHDIYLDKQGNIWLGTRTGGLEKIVFDNTLFKLNEFYSSKISSTGYEVRSIFEDNNKNIWIGNMNSIVSIYDQERRFKGFLSEDGSISKQGKPLNGTAYAFLQDKDGNIWIGTKGAGIFVLTPKDKEYTSFYIKQYKNDPDELFSLSDNAVYSIHEDDKGRIWIGTYGGGINMFDGKEGKFMNHKNNFNNYPIDMGTQIRTVQSHNDKIYVGTTLGLIVLSIDEENTTISDYKVYTKGYKIEDGLMANDIYDIYLTQNKNLYVATFGGGMAKVTAWDDQGFPSKFKTYDDKYGLHSDIVLSIREDNNNHLWINSEGNLSRFNPTDESFEQFNDVSRAISNQYFTEAIPLLTSDGELIYGCTHGTLSFVPNQIVKNNYIPYLALTKFKVSNKDYPLNVKIDAVNSIRLNHDENIFSIEYAALDYTNPHGISYAYKLEGFDKDWISSQRQRISNYTNIPPGEYVFKVRSTNSNGTWVENDRSLLITITPSFWQTKLAYFIYIVSFIFILYTILRAIFVFYRMKDKVLLEQEQTEMKTRFFTDISHEIRTPLTMIVSPIENILDSENTNPEVKPQLRLVLRNTNRMLKMVNQILDFRKIQKQRLQIKEIPIGVFVADLCNASFKIAENHNVSLEINNQIGSEKIWADPDAIEKLIFNLISNSVKHSTNGKKIEVNIFRKDKNIAIQVRDEGEGMTKEVLNKLFTRFASYSKDKSKPSTGIGLSIVKEIADKHHAKISVESDVNKGSCFTISFFSGIEHFSNDDNIDIIQSENNGEEQADITQENTETNEADSKLTILVVEDDTDLRGFIKSVLVPYYAVYEAANGKEGYDSAIKYMPDFILSDVMMPEMDGTKFLQNIRENYQTSHIPFIFLTAKTNSEDELKGITLGADDYITKPFSVKILIAKIDNILKRRKFSPNNLASNPVEVQKNVAEFVDQNKLTEQDGLFIKNLREEISNNLDNSDFVIDDLVAKTNLSRRVFFNKVKSLTGQAPIEFIREIRINHAAELIKTQQYRIKEVIYMVGFSDIRYFTQCFKEMYGMTPSQYRDQFKDNQ